MKVRLTEPPFCDRGHGTAARTADFHCTSLSYQRPIGPGRVMNRCVKAESTASASWMPNVVSRIGESNTFKCSDNLDDAWMNGRLARRRVRREIRCRGRSHLRLAVKIVIVVLHHISAGAPLMKPIARPVALRGYADSGSPAVISLDSCARFALMAV